MKLRIALCLFVSLLFLGISRASADTLTYTFTGTCLDCSDPQGTLVLQNYTPGTEITTSELVSFTYTSSLADISVTQSNIDGLTGTLENSGDVTFAAVFSEAGSTEAFTVWTDGIWCYGLSGTCSDCIGDSCGGGAIGIDHGVNGTFTLAGTPTPEPSTLCLFGTGLTMIAMFGRRAGSRSNRVPRGPDVGVQRRSFPA
jgi:hypothetical protein